MSTTAVPRASVERIREDGEVEDDDDVTVLPGKSRRPYAPGKKYRIPAQKLQKMKNWLNVYWSTLLDTEIHFKVAEQDWAYMTLPDTALFRNTFLSSFFFEPPVIVDAYAGVGMDSISFLYNLYWGSNEGIKMLYTVENYDDEARNQRLADNVQLFINKRDPSLQDKWRYHVEGTELFFKNCKTMKAHPISHIDLLYIDPPWEVPGGKNDGENGEATPTELLGFLYDTIFKHLIENEVHVRVVCIKTRFEWEKVAPFMDILKMHIHKKTERFTHCATVKNQPFKGVYYFHVIRTVEPEYGEWKPSKIFDYVYGKDRAIENGGRDRRRKINDKTSYANENTTQHNIVHHKEDEHHEIVAFEPEEQDESNDDEYDEAEKWETVINKKSRRGKVGMDQEVVSILQALHQRISRLELGI